MRSRIAWGMKSVRSNRERSSWMGERSEAGEGMRHLWGTCCVRSWWNSGRGGGSCLRSGPASLEGWCCSPRRSDTGRSLPLRCDLQGSRHSIKSLKQNHIEAEIQMLKNRSINSMIGPGCEEKPPKTGWKWHRAVSFDDDRQCDRSYLCWLSHIHRSYSCLSSNLLGSSLERFKTGFGLRATERIKQIHWPTNWFGRFHWICWQQGGLVEKICHLTARQQDSWSTWGPVCVEWACSTTVCLGFLQEL